MSETKPTEAQREMLRKVHKKYVALIEEVDILPQGLKQATSLGLATALIEGITKNKESALGLLDVMSVEIRKGRDTREYIPLEQP